jgi:hypothetical protein
MTKNISKVGYKTNMMNNKSKEVDIVVYYNWGSKSNSRPEYFYSGGLHPPEYVYSGGLQSAQVGYK